jgi:hypothetical protein
MNTLSFTIHFKKMHLCFKVFLECMIYFGELEEACSFLSSLFFLFLFSSPPPPSSIIATLSSSKMLHKLDFSHDALYCFVKYSIVEYQDGILILIIKSNAQKKIAQFDFGCEFHDLNVFYLEFFLLLHIP